MAGVPQIGSEVRYAIKLQDSVGQNIGAVGAHEIDIEKISPSSPVVEIPIPESAGSPGMTDRSMMYLPSGSIQDFNMTGGLDVFVQHIVSLCHFQKVSEGAATPFLKTFTPYTTHPQDSAVKVFTLWEYFPATGQTHVYRDCVVSELTHDADVDSDLVQQNASIKCFRSGYTEDIDSELASWNHSGSLSYDTYGRAGGGASPGGGYVDTNSLTATIDFNDGNGAVSVPLKTYSCTTGHEIAEGSYPDGAGGQNGWNITGQNGTYSITIMKTDDNRVETALANLLINKPIDVVVKKGDGTALGHLNDTWHGKTTNIELVKEKGQTIRATITGPVLKNTSSSDARSFAVVDLIDREL